MLYSFKGGSNGANPYYGALIFDASGALYGTTNAGGSTVCGGGCGTVFKLTPSGGIWTETVLYSFTAGNDGANPQAGLIFDASGALYGTTIQGGSGNCFGISAGCGTVFKLTPSGGATWTETLLWYFTGGSDSADPNASLIFDASGALYGTTLRGGTAGDGTVFKLSPPPISGGAWTETVLYSFTDGSDGAIPYARLISDAAGALYGTAYYGGNGGCTTFSAPNGCGTVFELIQPPQLIFAKQADFNADGKGDILWRCTDATSVACTDGTVAIWMMNADETVKQFAGGQVIPTGWTIAGTLDFNGDGISDILWRCTDLASAACTNGTVGEWLMNPNGTVNQYVGDQVIPSSWAIIE